MWVDWTGHEIHVARADTVLLSIDPINGRELRRLDLEWFHQQLAAFEASEIGIAFPALHIHIPPTPLVGFTDSRVVQVMSPYRVTFEEPPDVWDSYAVLVLGGSSNVADVATVNRVSVRSANKSSLMILTDGPLTPYFAQQVSEAVVRAPLRDTEPNTIGRALQVIQAVTVQSPLKLDRFTYTGGQVTSLRLRVFESAEAAQAATEQGEDEAGVLYETQLDMTLNGSLEGAPGGVVGLPKSGGTP
jgi:hypothetical protein